MRENFEMYPAFTKSNYLENTIDPHSLFDGIRPTSNFQNYVKAARACHPIVHEMGKLQKDQLIGVEFHLMDLGYLLKDNSNLFVKNGFQKVVTIQDNTPTIYTMQNIL